MFRTAPIPAVFRIDIEPDDHQPTANQEPWPGFLAMSALVDQMRDRLPDVSGQSFHPSWFLRLDPDIERCFGQADYVVRRHSEVFDHLIHRQDPLGIHVHAHRWDAERSVTFSDYADTDWTTNCVTTAADAFQNAFGERVRRSSQGGYLLTEAVLNTLIKRGIEVDVTVEPGLAAKPDDPSFGAYATAPSPDFRNCPRQPYYPSREAFDIPSPSLASARPILLVPLTSYDSYGALLPFTRRVVRRLRGRPRRHLPLNPWKQWPSPKVYWDLVAQAVEDQPVCYFAFAIRTDSPDAESHHRVRDLLEYLPKHPIARRLRFVDPLATEIRTLATPSAGAASGPKRTG